MTTEQRREPSKPEALLRAADPAGLHRYLGSLPPGETAPGVSRLNPEDQAALLVLLSPRQAADLVVELP